MQMKLDWIFERSIFKFKFPEISITINFWNVVLTYHLVRQIIHDCIGVRKNKLPDGNAATKLT